MAWWLACARVLAVAVVLAHEQRRQLVERRHVGGLVERALVAGAVAEEGDGDAVGLAVLGRERRAHRDGRPCADDAVGAEHAEVHVGDVHAAALAPAVARGAPEQFGVHAIERAALGDQMAMAPVGAGDPVLVRQVHHHPGRHGFLTHVKVQGTRYLAGFAHPARLRLERPDAHHPSVDVLEDIVAGCAHSRFSLPVTAAKCTATKSPTAWPNPRWASKPKGRPHRRGDPIAPEGRAVALPTLSCPARVRGRRPCACKDGRGQAPPLRRSACLRRGDPCGRPCWAWLLGQQDGADGIRRNSVEWMCRRQEESRSSESEAGSDGMLRFDGIEL